MSNEIGVSFRLTVQNGNYKTEVNPGLLQIDQTAQGAISGIVSVGYASEETLTLTDISTSGITFIRNLDATNFVDWGNNDGGTIKVIGRLDPGEFAFFRLKPGKALTLKSSTAGAAACKVQYLVLED